jgi:hypothetical protein
MTKDTTVVALTEGKFVSGYYNANRWPIQLVISRLNITLHLNPGEFILDKQGRKINDPFFEAYAKNKQLAREMADAPVPAVNVPVITSAVSASAYDGHSVHAVTEFKTDTKGVRQPVMPKAAAVADQSVNKPAYQGMSMDEARRAGLVRKVREVPEDYGTPDNNSSTPPPAPPMRIAMDTDQPARPQSLPPQMQAAIATKRPERQQIQKALAEGALAAADLDSETGFLNSVIRNNPTGAGIMAGKPAAQEEPAVDEAPLPAPQLEEALPEPTEEDEVVIPEPKVKPVKVVAKGQFVCMECAAPFKTRPELAAHARKLHENKVTAIMAAYPA